MLHGGDLGLALIDEETGERRSSGRALPASLEAERRPHLLVAASGRALRVGFQRPSHALRARLDLAGRLYGLGTYALPPFWVAMLAAASVRGECWAGCPWEDASPPACFPRRAAAF